MSEAENLIHTFDNTHSNVRQKFAGEKQIIEVEKTIAVAEVEILKGELDRVQSNDFKTQKQISDYMTSLIKKFESKTHLGPRLDEVRGLRCPDDGPDDAPFSLVKTKCVMTNGTNHHICDRDHYVGYNGNSQHCVAEQKRQPRVLKYDVGTNTTKVIRLAIKNSTGPEDGYLHGLWYQDFHGNFVPQHDLYNCFTTRQRNFSGLTNVWNIFTDWNL